jgi:small subunit ribosomal protein S9
MTTTLPEPSGAEPREPRRRLIVSRDGRYYATGRRKTATARVFLRLGVGRITVNGRGIDEYFSTPGLRQLAQQPLEAVEGVGRYDIVVSASGGGPSGQAGAVRHGIARALERLDPGLRAALKKAGFMTRDSRAKERKKYGQKGARKRFQYSKR